ncbi:MAG: YciI family protein [Bacteroidota bacterium]
MQQYLILLKGKKELDYSPEELQKRLVAYRSWVAQIGDNYIDGQRLDKTGFHFRAKDQVLTDGPFLEAKEIIAGYIRIKVKNQKEAVQITKRLPLLDHFEAYLRPIIQHD